MSSRRPAPLSPDTYAHQILSRVPELASLAEIDTRILCNLDSSDIGPDEWSALADEIARARDSADGVVVIHGTDTMSYTAAALSFALGGLDRPVVLTGSQRPLGEIRSDARRNLVGMAPALLERVGAEAGEGGARGVVLAAFGVGNVPMRARSVAPAVRRLVDGGVTVLVVTQAHAGAVDLALYENGAVLRDAGALSGGDMGIEAAVAKLMHGLGRFPADAAARAQYLVTDVAGERGDGSVHLPD